MLNGEGPVLCKFLALASPNKYKACFLCVLKQNKDNKYVDHLSVYLVDIFALQYKEKSHTNNAIIRYIANNLEIHHLQTHNYEYHAT